MAPPAVSFIGTKAVTIGWGHVILAGAFLLFVAYLAYLVKRRRWPTAIAWPSPRPSRGASSHYRPSQLKKGPAG